MSEDRLQGASSGPGCRPAGPSPSVSSAAAASIPRAELEAIIRRHIRCDASGLAPAVASVFLCGFEEAAGAIAERLARASDEAPDPYIAGLELTEQICFDKVKKERHAYREATKLFLMAAMQETPEQRLEHLDAALTKSRTLLSQSSKGE